MNLYPYFVPKLHEPICNIYDPFYAYLNGRSQFCSMLSLIRFIALMFKLFFKIY